MVYRLVLFLMMVSGCWGQGQTAYQLLYSGVQALPIAAVNITPSHNIGQSSHLVAIQFGNASGHTCTLPGYAGELQYSFDQVVWTTFGEPSNSSPTTLLNFGIYGTGVYPIVRFHVTNFDTTNCVFNAWYVGTVNSVIAPKVEGLIPSYTFVGIPAGSLTGTNTNPLFMGGLGSGALTPIGIADTSALILGTAASTTLIATVPNTQSALRVHSYAVTSSAAGTFKFQSSNRGTTCAGGLTDITGTMNLAANGALSVGNGIGYVLILPPGKDLCITTVGAGAAVMGHISYSVLF